MHAAKVLLLPSSCVPAHVVNQRDYLSIAVVASQFAPREINAAPQAHFQELIR